MRMAVCGCLFFSALAHPAPIHHCAADAVMQAKQLVQFHTGTDRRIDIENSIKVLAPIRNPANRKQYLDVLEVWGYVYKAQYRVRLIYSRLPRECLLMGQEILEYASL